jgi:hypothetical protein
VIPRGILFASGARQITPGNGLFLTSSSTAVSVGYSYTGLKRWSISTGADYSNSQSLGNFVGGYTGMTITSSISRQIVRNTHGLFSFSARRYGSNDFKNYNKWSYALHAGLGFTPGDIPIRLW